MTSAPAGVRRILLIRLSAIGDIVFATPLVRALRRRYPDAHLAWLVQAEYRSLLEAQPELDEVVAWPVSEWRGLWRDRRLAELARRLGRFRTAMLQKRFDLAIDLQGLLKSGALARLSGAPTRIGLGSREGSQLLMTEVIERGGDSDRIGSEYLFLAEHLGLPTDRFVMEVGLTEADERFARELPDAEGFGSGYAALCPFTTRPQKHWVPERWTELAARLRADFGLAALLLGGPGDRAGAETMAGGPLGGFIDMAGRTTLRQAAALVKHARLVIGVDTGLTHMGIAFGRPTLALFGSTCPYVDTTRANARVLYHPMICSPCRRRPTCRGDFTCMKAIGVDEVLGAAAHVLSAPPS